MNRNSLSIIGGGFVGFACYQVFSQIDGFSVGLYDINKENCKAFKEGKDVNFISLEEAAESDVVFLCLPTPMIEETGECYIGIVERAIADLRNLNKENYIVIKSTIPPSTTERLNFNFGKIVFSPEFLTEKNYKNDFIELPYQILGYSEPQQRIDEGFQAIENLFFEAFRQGIMACEKVYTIPSRMAEMVKYTRNCYLATRLSYFNEIKQICDKLEIEFDEMKYLAGLDPRVGQHYNRVDEEEPEYSGSCLPKDINGLREFAKKHGVDPKMLTAAWEKNLEVAKKKSWETMSGRAIIKKK